MPPFDEDGKLTGEFDTATLKDYLNFYFITGAKKHHRGLILIPVPVSKAEHKTESSVAPNLIYTDNGSTLNLELQGHGKCQVVSTYSTSCLLLETVVSHLIDGVFFKMKT